MLFLQRLPTESSLPTGIEPESYYWVLEKYTLSDSTAIGWKGNTISVSEVEQMIARIHGVE